MTITSRLLGVLALSLVAGSALLAREQTGSDVGRRLHVTAVNERGEYVADLTAADFTLKDGGKERAILRVEPLKERLKVALAIDELIAGDVITRQATVRFFGRLQTVGDVALYVMSRRSEKRLDYTSQAGPFLNAINGLPPRAQYQGNLVEAVYEIAKEQRTIEGRRIIVTIAPEFPQLSSITANGVLDQLRDNGIAFYAATLVGATSSSGAMLGPDGGNDAGSGSSPTRLEGGDMTQQIERDRVINDGPKQSGGLRVASSRIEGIPAALDRISAELLHQYVVTYTIPAGTKSDGKVSLSAKRKGITLRGPTLLPKV